MRTLLLIVLALGAGATQADDLVYVGAGIVRSNIQDIAATNSSVNNTSWKAMIGLRPISMFAGELDYIDLGSDTIGGNNGVVHFEYKAVAGYAVGFVPIPVPYLDVFGKVGLARWSSSGSSVSSPTSGFFSLSNNGTEFAWGIGTQVHFGHIGARLEYENFSVPNTNGANVFSLEVFLTFL